MNNKLIDKSLYCELIQLGVTYLKMINGKYQKNTVKKILQKFRKILDETNKKL